MKDVNKILLLGRLGNDPVHRETKNGTGVTHFSLATSRRFQRSSPLDDGGDSSVAGDEVTVEETEWHKVVTWGKLAKACSQYLKKGQTAFVSGEIRTRKYQKEGKDRYFVEVYADEVSFLGRRPAAAITEPEIELAS